ncbi:hypothetical protein ACFWYW_55740 [Nonomuraea sp. NPDC059023]|uniref:hypothetical protein n=1 Tax=unclassified Nonomuraea TaxID=2593643 RepID=UPI00368CB76B
MSLISPPVRPRARIIHASWVEAVSADSVGGVRMYWVCECGHDGVDVVGSQGVCPGCRRHVTIPETETVSDT